MGHPQNEEVKMTKSITFHVSREYIRKFTFTDSDDKKFTIHHVYPTLADFVVGNEIPESVNPRTHAGSQCLKGKLSEKIRETIREEPHNFVLANRGSMILDSSIHYDESNEMLTIYFEQYEGPTAIHGIPDGATTNAVIADVQKDALEAVLEATEEIQSKIKSFADLSRNPTLIPDYLKNARLHLEIITGIEDRERIALLSEGRNTSLQVKSWTMEDFKGHYDWLKSVLDQQLYKDKIGYEENAGADVEILDVLAILNLFHESYTQNDSQPTQSYSAKGSMLERVIPKEGNNNLVGFKKLAPIVPDVLALHDLVLSTLPEIYNKNCGNCGKGGKLGALVSPVGLKVFKKLKTPKLLNFSKYKASHKIPNSILYPLLASMRALIRDEGWHMRPEDFWNKNCVTLVKQLFERFVDDHKQNPNVCGKSSSTYRQLFVAVDGIITKIELQSYQNV